jgi:ribonuclease E
MDEGAAGLVADEFEPPLASEAAGADTGFDGYAPQIALPEVQPEPIAPAAEPQPTDRPPTDTVRPTVAEASSTEKAAPRRSTVREKVSFPSGPVSETATPAPDTQVASTPPAPAEPAPEASASEAPPRRAGWWSRRFGGGQ